jgi:uncharacterized membrane protein
MRTWKPIIFNIIFAGNCLLVFLLLTEKYMDIPAWLQVAGRMHPLVLHFPLVLLIISILWEIGFERTIERTKHNSSIGDFLLLATAGTAVIAALMGLILAREEGYDADLLQLHKWGGVLLSVICISWYSTRKFIRKRSLVLYSSAIFTGLVLVVTGHEGASITHGANFLLAPVEINNTQLAVPFEEARVFEEVVHPILEAKCNGCHNARKAKGELVMETPAGFLKGGKNGILWDTTASDLGLLLRRIHLPLNDKKHMPPKGKPELTPEETSILYHWIKSGATTTTLLSELSPSDSLRIIAAHLFSADAEEIYSFPAASEDKIHELSDNYRVVTPIAFGSPALQVSFYGVSEFDAGQLKELLQLKEQVVDLNLDKMPVTDKELQLIRQFTALRQLNLAFTNITDSGVAALQSLKELKRLSISGTRVTEAGIKKVLGLPKLQHIYCWNTNMSDAGLATLQKQKKVKIEAGFAGDTVIIKLNAPSVENEEEILTQPVPLKLKHYVKGVDIRYTTNGQEPDSIQSAVYSGTEKLDSAVTLKVKAFKKGWVSSETVSKQFYKSGYIPDSMRFITAPDSGYQGKGAATLFDGVKGDFDFRNGKWIGYRKKQMSLLVRFDHPQQINSVSMSGMVDIGGYILPPVEIQVWGGTDENNLKKLGVCIPVQPTKMGPSYMTAFITNFPKTSVSVLRLLVKPVPKLPGWHPGKGEKAWIFTDEVFLNPAL